MHGIVGLSVFGIGRRYTALFSEVGVELPQVTSLLVAYCATPAPILAGIVLALGSGGGLLLASRSERARPCLPLLVVVFWLCGLLHLAMAWMGFGIGLISLGP